MVVQILSNYDLNRIGQKKPDPLAAHDEVYIKTLEKNVEFLEDEIYRLERRIEFYESKLLDKFDIDRYVD